MNSPSLQGVWTHPSLSFPEHDEFMSIDESRGRIVTFVVVKTDPVRRAPMCNWFRRESATSIAVKLRPSDQWRVHEFQVRDGRVLWTYAGGMHSWRRAAADEHPEWLEAEINKANAKMDEAERCAVRSAPHSAVADFDSVDAQ